MCSEGTKFGPFGLPLEPKEGEGVEVVDELVVQDWGINGEQGRGKGGGDGTKSDVY